ncbi:ubiquinone biosynthesis protein [Tropilaelaps mercedesae]|uniref:5-demethoxyubiquinone hydroxylase, mitochondrial n=1 Tax=Tropilaelaps mercedesae TaxID=418985 RepID=A0A1V9XAP9_9ACAR|nr:ubiquinone biosynthesis protein [Tropilaelaps mercedesae]
MLNRIRPAVVKSTRCASIAAHRREMYDRIIRVNHAGEFGADRIYAGQMAVLGNTDAGRVVRDMWEQEKNHLRMFKKLVDQHGVRQTALMPFWSVAGFTLGAGSALMGKEMAMACTIAVESIIIEHYNDQIKQLTDDDPIQNEELLNVLTRCRDDEEHHHDLGVAHQGMDAPIYNIASCLIKMGCRLAIATAKRI